MKKNHIIEENIENPKNGISVTDFFHPQSTPEETQTIDRPTDGVYRRFLHVVFDNVISRSELSAFRGAIINKAGKENTLFHNHTNNGYLYKYPLIQYKLYRNIYPSILCIEKGVDEIYHLFKHKHWDINLKGKNIDLKVKQLILSDAYFKQCSTFKKYNISNWLALNKENYQKYNSFALKDKIALLENILKANILAMAKGINWHISDKIELIINNINRQKVARYKGVKLLAFNLSFQTNVILPQYLSLGKGASMGFGVITEN
ncbi:MAG: hypothetical protein KatS3mg096_861 [Candidatus Parcubacteria bacterium]|nr:MAG: hypothetical protein KatS3mg096_861 [Candidatus Parcubacteria bacterium]